MLRVDPRNPRAAALHAALTERVDLTALPDDVCVVIGGDGHMLRCIQELGGDVTFLGLNAGTLGFLLNDAGDIDTVADKLAEGRWRAWSFPRLQLDATGLDGERLSALAVNDLYVERATGQTAQLRVSVDGATIVERLICDGIIVATALGSTAYSYSAGGVPCHPAVRVLQISPISAHSPRLSPVVLPLEARIDIEAHSPERRRVRAVADGEDIGRIARATVQVGDDDVRLAFLEGHEFTETLVAKVLKH